MITLDALETDGIRHAFFTRRGGVSRGVFASLNCGFGSGDRFEDVARNRAIAMARLDLDPGRLVGCYQIHSAAVVTVERPWRPGEAPRADGLVTRTPGIALGVLTADCAPVLLHDRAARVVGAAHAGWRGALSGILEATLAGMTALGAECRRIRAGIGPCIGPHSYEVGPEFADRFLTDDAANARFFASARRPRHFMFDLPGYVAGRLARAGIGAVEHAGHDTVAEGDRFFSYRRASRDREGAYGRALAAIALED